MSLSDTSSESSFEILSKSDHSVDINYCDTGSDSVSDIESLSDDLQKNVDKDVGDFILDRMEKFLKGTENAHAEPEDNDGAVVPTNNSNRMQHFVKDTVNSYTELEVIDGANTIEIINDIDGAIAPTNTDERMQKFLEDATKAHVELKDSDGITASANNVSQITDDVFEEATAFEIIFDVTKNESQNIKKVNHEQQLSENLKTGSEESQCSDDLSSPLNLVTNRKLFDSDYTGGNIKSEIEYLKEMIVSPTADLPKEAVLQSDESSPLEQKYKDDIEACRQEIEELRLANVNLSIDTHKNRTALEEQMQYSQLLNEEISKLKKKSFEFNYDVVLKEVPSRIEVTNVVGTLTKTVSQVDEHTNLIQKQNEHLERLQFANETLMKGIHQVLVNTVNEIKKLRSEAVQRDSEIAALRAELTTVGSDLLHEKEERAKLTDRNVTLMRTLRPLQDKNRNLFEALRKNLDKAQN